MRRLLTICLVVVSAHVWAEDETAGGATVITANRLSFDYERYSAVFEENVVVSDPQIRMESDKLNVLFDGEDNVKSVTAMGNVRLRYEDKTGSCGRAVYLANKGQIVLAESAVLRRGRDAVMGEKITVWIGEDRMLCEPGRLVIFPQRKTGQGWMAPGAKAPAPGRADR